MVANPARGLLNRGKNKKRKGHSKVVIKREKFKNVTDYNPPVTPPVDAKCLKLTKGLETYYYY